jgi:hypothetical protein
MPDLKGHAGKDGDDGRAVRESDGAFDALPPSPARLCFVAEPLSFSPTVAVHVSPFDRNVIERMRLPVGAGAHPQASASSP